MGQIVRRLTALFLVVLLMLGLIFSFSQRLRQRAVNYIYQNVRFRPWGRPTGFDAETTRQMNAYLDERAFGEITSVLVWQAGEMRFEHYSPPYNAESVHHLFSISKSVTSAVVGIAMADSGITLDDSLSRLLPDYEALLKPGSMQEEMTLEDILTMRSGFEWNELSGPSYREMQRSDDWLAHMLTLPLVAEPGGQFNYNSGNTVLLGGIVDRSGAGQFETLLEEKLFGPLGIEEWRWLSGPGGTIDAGSGLHLRSDDLLKFGILYLQNGEWNGAQLVPADWVAASTKTEVFNSSGLNYGYHWWQMGDDDRRIESLSQNDGYLATGFGGNYLFVIPHLEAVVVITGQNGSDMSRTDPLLRFYIFPALVGESLSNE